MNLRPALTTSAATALLVIIATLPLREVFNDWDWAISVIGAGVVACAVASAVETIRPRVSLPALSLFTAVSAAAWALSVSLRDVFWSSPGSSESWADLGDGIFNGWGALLDEQVPLTDPQSAETFVAFLVWITGAAAVHVAARRRSALAAIAAGATVLGVTTAAALPRGLSPAILGGGAGVMALFAIATLTRAPDQQWRAGRTMALVTVMGVAGGVATLAGSAITSIDRAPVDPRTVRSTETISIEVPDVLAEYGVRRQEAKTILTIDSAAPPSGVRLRLQVYDGHNGERWLPSAGFEEIATFPALDELPPGDLISMTITIDELDGPWLPIPDRLISIDAMDIRWNEEAQTMIADEPPTEYEFAGTLVPRSDLEGLETLRDEVPERLSKVPAGLPESIQSVAAEVTAGSTDAVSAIDAITARLRTLGRDETNAPGNSFARLRDDLESDSATGAEQIASLHALMLRAVGIPSRLVVGYVANGPLVESADLHVWVEAAFPDGWVAFDPVPTVTETGPEIEDDPTVTTTSLQQDAPLQARALPRELGPGEDPDEPQIGTDDAFTLTDAISLAILSLVGIIILMIGLRLIRRRFRRSSGWRAEVRVLGAWAEMVDRLRELGAPITGTTTTGDVVYMAGEMDETLGAHTEVVAGFAGIALHSPDGSTPDEAIEAWEQLRLAESRITLVRGRRVVPRRYLDPRVLRYRAPRPPKSRDGGHRTEIRPPSRES